ncbi:MAG: fibronectin type III domain-containing protein, partial [archaeon]
MHRQIGNGGYMFIDDMCIYTGSVDNSSPNSPQSVNATAQSSSSMLIQWTSPTGGVDGGGYLAIRYLYTPSESDDPNPNGIYAVDNTITVSNTGTVRYVGTETSFTDSDLSPNTTYYYKVYTYDKAYNYSTEGEASDTSLPVELTSFTAKPSGNSVTLAWSTESEIENLGFILEKRSIEQSAWSKVADYLTDKALAGHGSTTEKHSYSFTDAGVQPGATYAYRLADVDYSGAVTWHKEVEVKVEVESGKMVEGFHIGALY